MLVSPFFLFKIPAKRLILGLTNKKHSVFKVKMMFFWKNFKEIWSKK